MLDVGFSELLLIAVVALVVVGPKDLPVVIRHAARFLREMRSVYAGIKRQMSAVMDEVGAADIKREMTTIIDLEGKPQQAFDVRELGELSKLASSPLPAAGHTSQPRVARPESSQGATSPVAASSEKAVAIPAAPASEA